MRTVIHPPSRTAVAGALELAMQVPAGAALAVSSVDDVHGGAGPDPATSARQQGVDWL